MPSKKTIILAHHETKLLWNHMLATGLNKKDAMYSLIRENKLTRRFYRHDCPYCEYLRLPESECISSYDKEHQCDDCLWPIYRGYPKAMRCEANPSPYYGASGQNIQGRYDIIRGVVTMLNEIYVGEIESPNSKRESLARRAINESIALWQYVVDTGRNKDRAINYLKRQNTLHKNSYKFDCPLCDYFRTEPYGDEDSCVNCPWPPINGINSLARCAEPKGPFRDYDECSHETWHKKAWEILRLIKMIQ